MIVIELNKSDTWESVIEEAKCQVSKINTSQQYSLVFETSQIEKFMLNSDLKDIIV